MLRDDFSPVQHHYLTDFRPFGAYLPPPSSVVSDLVLILIMRHSCPTLWSA